MKVTTKRDGKHTWLALKDKEGFYHCWFDDRFISKSLVLAGNLYLTNGFQLPNIKNILKKEGHK